MKAGVGYQRRGAVSHRRYSRNQSVNKFKRTGKFTYVGTKVGKKTVYGLGHKAGESWGDKKDIDPKSQVRKYSKNSPSFDEGVYQSKKKRMAEKMK